MAANDSNLGPQACVASILFTRQSLQPHSFSRCRFWGLDSPPHAHNAFLPGSFTSFPSWCPLKHKSLNFDGGKIIYLSLATYVCISARFIKRPILLSIDVNYWFNQKLIDHKYKGLFLDFKFYFVDLHDTATFSWILQLLEIWILGNRS